MDMIWHLDRYRITDAAVCDATGTPLLWWSKRSKLQLIQTQWDCAVFAEEARSREILTLRRFMSPGYSAVWDVTETASGRLLGRMRRPSNFKVLSRWYEIVDGSDQPLGELVSTMPAVLTMFLHSLLPQSDALVAGGHVIATFKRNPWWLDGHFDLVRSMSDRDALDPRLCVAAGLALLQTEPPSWA